MYTVIIDIAASQRHRNEWKNESFVAYEIGHMEKDKIKLKYLLYDFVR